MARYGDTFLRGRWEERAQHERGEYTPEEEKRMQDIMQYIDIHKRAEEAGVPLLKFLEDVERYAIRYQRTINETARMRTDVRQGAAGVDHLTASDQNRKLAHTALVDAVNILSRQFREAGLDNEWRRSIGLERDDVGRWGEAIAAALYRKFEGQVI